MADLTIDLNGIKSPNPFWIASGPPSNSAYQAKRAFDAGWGGFVWKTIGEPIRNVSSRYGAISYGGYKMAGFSNIELISDRGVQENFDEIYQVKKEYPNNAVIASLMVEKKEQWKDVIKRAEDSGADGLELNYGCPHGMCERGMGSAVGQEPKVLQEVTSWVMEYSNLPVIVKLTPNISEIIEPAMAAQEVGADAVSLINTIKSIVQVDLDDFIAHPKLRNGATNGGYCGPAVKPIALQMVSCLSKNPNFNLGISGIGGISTWRDAAEFIALGCTSVQVCTAVMHYGFRIVEDLISGLNQYLDSKKMVSVNELRSKAIPNLKEWGDLDMNYKTVAKIDADKCIGCNLCYIACEDGAHQAIDLSKNLNSKTPTIKEAECVGCNLCALVCPVENCISMVDVSENPKLETWNNLLKQGYQVSQDTV